MGQQRFQQVRFEWCEQCGKPFLTSRKHAKTCSDKCRKARSRAGQKSKPRPEYVTLQDLEQMLECHVLGVPFV